MAELFLASSFDEERFRFVWGGDFETSEELVICRVGENTGEYQGNFSIAGEGAYSATLNAYAQYNGVTIEFLLTSMDLDADIFFEFLEQDDHAGSLTYALSQADYIIGSSEADRFSGKDGDDRLEGAGGDDELSGGQGDDTLDGGIGFDTVSVIGAQSEYSITVSSSGVLLSDRKAGREGIDVLSNIEVIRFDDRVWQLSLFEDVANLSMGALSSFVEVYIAYFNRAPDAEGLFFYGTAFANGSSLEDSAATFLNSAEYQANYPGGLSNQKFAEAVYTNVLGRIPDLEGFDFWVGALDSGAISRDNFILEVLNGAKASPPSGAKEEFILQKAADVAYLSNKTDVGLYFAVIKGMSNVANATTIMQLFDDGEETDIDAAMQAIDELYTKALDPVDGEFLLQLVGLVDDPFFT